MYSAFIVILACSTCIHVLATELTENDFDHTQTGSIIIDYRYNESPLDDVAFQVYHVATLNEGEEIELLSPFQEVTVDLDSLNENSNWIQFSNELENYINYEMIEPESVFYTDNAGAYKLEDLELGIYFIQGHMVEENGVEIYSEPILMMVGSYNDTGEKWEYHYTVQPKVLVINDMGENHVLTVQKVWKNTNSDLLIPDEVQVELRCNGETYDIITLSEANKWTYTWYNIDPNQVWAVKELTELELFTVNYEKELFDIQITNTYIGDGDEELPQTGSMGSYIPICSSLGVICILLGTVLNYKTRCKEDD